MASSSYIQLIAKIQAFCDAHLQIQRFDAEFGEQRPNLATESEKYPYVFLSPTNGVPNYDLNTITVEITCYDIIQKDRDNLNTIVSDCHQILTDLYGYYNQGEDSDILALSATQTPLNNYDLDYVAGWSMSVEFELEGWCNNAIPMTPITPGSGDCEDANYTLKDTAGATLSSGSIVSGGSADITAPDATVTLNSGAFNDYESGSTNDIILQDQDSNPITPDSVVGNTITVTTGGAGLDTKSATLLKTNQTVSYRTGDDADRQEGRATDFFTLPGNNPFGNLNRFTDETGAQTYTNNIVIDWSTYDGSTVLGYDKRDQGLSIWDDAIDNALAHSTGGFSSGWYLPNVNEIMNLFDLGQSQRLNYSPFFLSSMTLWSSSSQTSAQSWSPVSAGNTILARGSKTGSRKSIYARQFTNAELGI